MKNGNRKSKYNAIAHGILADILLVGDSQQLVALLKDGKGRRLTGPAISWTSFDPDTATVSPTGVVMSHAPGTARIVATSEGKSGTAVITVWPTKKDTAECSASRPGWIWCDDFEKDRLSSYFAYGAHNGDFVRLPGVGYGGSVGMRARFSRGQVQGGVLHLAFGRTPRSYLRPVDAGTAVYRELEFANRIVNTEGIVVIDDFFSPRYPANTTEAIRYLEKNPFHFRLLAVGFNKGYLCRPESLPRYMDFMASGMSGALSAYGAKTTIFKTTGPWDTDAVGITDYVDDAGPIAGPDNEPQRWHMMRTRHVWGPMRHLQNGWRMLRRR